MESTTDKGSDYVQATGRATLEEAGDENEEQEEQEGSIQDSAATTLEVHDEDHAGMQIEVEALDLHEDWMSGLEQLNTTQFEFQAVILGCQLNDTERKPRKIDYLWLTVVVISRHEEITVSKVMERMRLVHSMTPGQIKQETAMIKEKDGGLIRRNGAYMVNFGRFFDVMDGYRHKYFHNRYTALPCAPKLFRFSDKDVLRKRLKLFCKYLALYDFVWEDAYLKRLVDGEKYKSWPDFQRIGEEKQQIGGDGSNSS